MVSGNFFVANVSFDSILYLYFDSFKLVSNPILKLILKIKYNNNIKKYQSKKDKKE